MSKTRQNNDVIEATSVVYVKKEIELLGLIRPSAAYDEN